MPTQLVTVVLCALPILLAAFKMLLSRRWEPRGRHCLVTGGSSGLGLAMAILLVKRGAHVSIVARNEQKLEEALHQLEQARTNPDQILKAYSFAVDSEARSAAAIDAAALPHGGRCPDAFFLCAGASRPGFFIEQTEQSIRDGMQMTFNAQAFTALVATKMMVKQGVKGKVVFTSSILAYFSMVGYSTYSPGKFAIRGLAETLQSEMMLYGIQVHISFPATILSPGLAEENVCKPSVTLKIEETDEGTPPESIAKSILKGVQKGKFHITHGFIGNVFRASSAGSSPRSSYLVDLLYGLIGFVALPIWRKTVDQQVMGHRKEHEGYLRDKGVLTATSK